MDDEDARPPQPQELISRVPTEADLVSLCRNLNEQHAKYIVLLRLFEAQGQKPPD